ncbi:MAG: toll/interleukin-1 receptor domain-containing protein [Myxococcales bacterium]|nr:toll/interleukin-1 receptor domain-containing protein [Myxococcales bacterium]
MSCLTSHNNQDNHCAQLDLAKRCMAQNQWDNAIDVLTTVLPRARRCSVKCYASTLRRLAACYDSVGQKGRAVDFLAAACYVLRDVVDEDAADRKALYLRDLERFAHFPTFFISYAHKDARATRLLAVLNGIIPKNQLYHDQHFDAGISIEASISHAMENATTLVLLMSNVYMTRPWCLRELNTALFVKHSLHLGYQHTWCGLHGYIGSKVRRIIPVALDSNPNHNSVFAGLFSDLKWLDATGANDEQGFCSVAEQIHKGPII